MKSAALGVVFALLVGTACANGGTGFAMTFQDDGLSFVNRNITDFFSDTEIEFSISFYYQYRSLQQGLHAPISYAVEGNDNVIAVWGNPLSMSVQYRTLAIQGDVLNKTFFEQGVHVTACFPGTVGTEAYLVFNDVIVKTVEITDLEGQYGKDGALQPSRVGSLILGQEQDQVFGGFDKDQAAIGQLDELRIWKKYFPVANYTDASAPMTQAEAAIDPTLWAYWDFDTYSDLSMYAHHLGANSLNGAPQKIVLGPSAFKFDAMRDVIVLVEASGTVTFDYFHTTATTVTSIMSGLTCATTSGSLVVGTSFGSSANPTSIDCTFTGIAPPLLSSGSKSIVNSIRFGTDPPVFFFLNKDPEEIGLPPSTDSTTDTNVGTSGTTLTATTITFTPADLTITTEEDQSVEQRLPGQDVDGQKLTAIISVFPAKGSLFQKGKTAPINATHPEILIDRTITFVPGPDESGANYTSFKYQLVDEAGGRSTDVHVNVKVNNANDAPAVSGLSLTLVEEATVDITLTATDADGTPTDHLVGLIKTLPKHGALYHHNEDGSLGDKIIRPYKPWDLGPPLLQYANNATHYSSTYGATAGDSWSFQKMVGPSEGQMGCHGDTFSPLTNTPDPAIPIEFIQFTVDTPVWPTEMKLQWAAGGYTTKVLGRAKQGTGTFIPLWEARKPEGPLYLDPPICTPRFLMQEFRIEFDLAPAIISGAWSCLDAVEVVGQTFVAQGVLTHSTKKVKYVPDEDYSGPDFFEYSFIDCLERAFKQIDYSAESEISRVNLTVTGVNDAPVVNTPASIVLKVKDEPYFFSLATAITDPDDASHTVTIEAISSDELKIYNAGDFIPDVNSSVSLDPSWELISAGTTLAQSNATLAFISDCKDTFQGTVTFSVTDASGAKAVKTKFVVDNTCVTLVVSTLDATAADAFSAIAGLGLALALMALAVTVIYWKTPVIKLAQPYYLLTTLLGCIVLYAGIIVYAKAPKEISCAMSLSMYSLGFTLVFMSFYVKTYRIDKIFNTKSVKAVTAASVAKRFCAGVGIEVIFVIVWGVLSPLVLTITETSPSSGYEMCGASNEMGGPLAIVCLGFKAIHLGTNVNLAYKVRKVNSAFNESKLIGFCVYNFAFFVCVLFPMGLSMPDPTTGFIIMTLGVWMPTTATVVAMFGSKAFIAIITPGENTMAEMSGGEFGVKVRTGMKSKVGGSGASGASHGGRNSGVGGDAYKKMSPEELLSQLKDMMPRDELLKKVADSYGAEA